MNLHFASNSFLGVVTIISLIIITPGPFWYRTALPCMNTAPLHARLGVLLPWRQSQPGAPKCGHLYENTFQIYILTRRSASLTPATRDIIELHCHLNWRMACPVPELMSLHSPHLLVPLRRSRARTFHQVKPAVKSSRMGQQFKCANRLVRRKGVQILCFSILKNVRTLNVNRMALNAYTKE